VGEDAGAPSTIGTFFLLHAQIEYAVEGWFRIVNDRPPSLSPFRTCPFVVRFWSRCRRGSCGLSWCSEGQILRQDAVSARRTERTRSLGGEQYAPTSSTSATRSAPLRYAERAE
jgi:hypothetical protein